MLNRLKHWAHRRTRPGNDDNDDPPVPVPTPAPALPFLPSPRPSRLTPSPSREDLPLLVHKISPGTSNSPFFQHLPAEIRRLILIEAFGDRTVHMDLDLLDDGGYMTEDIIPPVILRGEALRRALDSEPEEIGMPTVNHYGMLRESNIEVVTVPTGTGSRRPRRPSGSVRLWRISEEQGSSGGSSRNEERQWEWWSSVCHRDVESRLRCDPRKLVAPEPWRDTCRRGKARCDGWRGDIPDKCILGVMGWLLSCRQAYSEGIEVLYATNTIHMTGTALMLNLPDLILPQRLAMITSLEMIWYYEPPSREAQGEELRLYLKRGQGLFHEFLKGITPTVFPSLRRLRISLLWDPLISTEHMGKWAVRRITGEILIPLDDVVGEFSSSRLDFCYVDLYHSLWFALENGGFWKDHIYEYAGPYEYDAVLDVARHVPCPRVWRPLSVSKEMPGDRAEGYWICEGEDDTPPYPFAHINPDFDYMDFRLVFLVGEHVHECR